MFFHHSLEPSFLPIKRFVLQLNVCSLFNRLIYKKPEAVQTPSPLLHIYDHLTAASSCNIFQPKLNNQTTTDQATNLCIL